MAAPFSPVVAASPWHGGGTGYWNTIKDIVPRSYLVYRTNPDKPVLFDDGDIFSDCWSHAPWTEPFLDIEGPQKHGAPPMETRMKMLWDDEALYVGAWMEESKVIATLKEKNSVIFNDNDFEVFINPDGSNHQYYEFEVNALNTIWELRLDKPYRYGGSECSARVGMAGQGNLPHLRSAVKVHGVLNDPATTDKGWSVVCRFPFADLVAQGHCASPPRAGGVWRLNSSRVQWKNTWVPAEGGDGGQWVKVAKEGHGQQGEDNWVWSPQGVINMHCPERWGFIHFHPAAGPPPAGAAVPAAGEGGAAGAGECAVGAGPPADWAARETALAAHCVMMDFVAKFGRPAASLEELGVSLPPAGVAAAGVEQREGVPGGTVVWAEISEPGGGGGGGGGAAGRRRRVCMRGDALVWSEEV